MDSIFVFMSLGFGLVLVLYWIATYNRLTRLRNEVREAAGTLAAQLQQRHELVPDMASAARESAQVQREYLRDALTSRERIAGVRDGSEGPHEEACEAKYQERTGPIAFAESTPQMSIETYTQAQKVQAATEEDIAAARRFLQAAVAEYNSAIQAFPSCLVATMGGFQPYNFHRVSDEIAAKPEVWVDPRSN